MSRGRGHVRQRPNGSWVVVIDLGNDPVTGKRRREWHSGFRTKGEAEKRRTEILKAIDSGAHVAPTKASVADYLTNRWLPAIRASVRANTLSLYETIVRVYVVPHVGTVPLQDLTPDRLNGLYGLLLDCGSKTGKPLAAKTVRNVHGMLSRALADAVRWDLLLRNPAERADPPRISKPPIETWTADEQRRFLEHIAGDRMEALYALACSTGMRRSELLGLGWRSVDLDEGGLVVEQVLVRGRDRLVIAEPKTARSRRSIALDERTVRALRDHRKRQLEERMAAGSTWQDNGLVFTREDGSMFRPATFTRTLQRVAGEAGVPVIGPHGLRHTWATLALRAGVNPRVVADRLGHSGVSITLDRYTHPSTDLDREAAERVAGLISG